MKILAAGDIHGDARLAQQLAEKADNENVDLVILCGDLTQFEQSTENIVGPFRAKGKNVAIIPGNHESAATTSFLAELYDAVHLHGYSIKAEDVGIFGCGGANVGPHFVSDSETTELLGKGHDYVKDLSKKIMVTHVHPAGSKIEQFTQLFPGSAAVRDAVDQFKPDFLLCSHVHEAEGIEEKIGNTTVMNVGKQGKIIEL